MPGGPQNGGTTVYPGYQTAVHQGAPPPSVPYPLRPSMPPGSFNGPHFPVPPANLPHPQVSE
jgi:hypothetical protein